MNVDIAVLIFLAIFCIVGFWRGLVRQVLQVLALICAIAILYAAKETLISQMATRLTIRGFAARGALLVLLFVIWLILYWALALPAKRLLKKKFRPAGAILGLIRGLAVITLALVFCDLAFPTIETEFPGAAGILRGSTFFGFVQKLDRSKLNPLGKWGPFERARDVFRAPVDYSARVRLEEDPNFHRLQSTRSLSALNEDSAFQQAAREGNIRDSLRNPKLLRCFNDEEAYRAFLAFMRGEGEGEGEAATTTVAEPPPPAGEEAEDPSPPPPPTKLIILNNGNRLEGIISAQDDREVTADVVMGNDRITVTFGRGEILEIRDID